MSDWIAEGGSPEARRFVQEWLDNPSSPMPTLADVMREVAGLNRTGYLNGVSVTRGPGPLARMTKLQGHRPQRVLVDEIYGFRPHYPPLIINRQLYDHLRRECPKLSLYFEPWEPPLLDYEVVQAAVNDRLPAYFPPSKPLIEECHQ